MKLLLNLSLSLLSSILHWQNWIFAWENSILCRTLLLPCMTLVNPFSLLSLNDFHFQSQHCRATTKNENLISSLRFEGNFNNYTTVNSSDDNNKMRLSHYTYFFSLSPLLYTRAMMIKEESENSQTKIVSWINFCFIKKNFFYINARILKIPHISSLSLTL